uniref:RNA polymerase sigma factor n=1 Tax=Stenotrophomonas geniculata TaxID=86188 RepID=UPI003BF8F4FD
VEDAAPVFASEENALDKMAAAEIAELVNKLPTGYRLVFNLYIMEQYSHKEIADELGISEGTSKSQLARARNYLQKSLKKNEHIQDRQFAG